MRVYIAGSSKDMPRVEALIERVRALGHMITFDWCAHVRSAPGGANGGTPESLRIAADLCRKGALDAQIVWIAIPPLDKPTAGAWWEGSVAYEHGWQVWTSEPKMLAQFCIFKHLPGVRSFASDEDVLIALASGDL